MRRREFLLSAAASTLRAAAFGREVIGANTAMAGYSLTDAIAAIRRIGLPAIEIHPMGVPQAMPGKFPGFEFDTLSAAEKRGIKESLAGFRRITTHLPYDGLSPFAAGAPLAEHSRKKVAAALEATQYFGAELAVLHIIPPKDRSEAEARPLIVEQVRRWGDIAARGKFKIAIETGYPGSVAEFPALIREIAHDAVGCTIDVGHQKAYRELVARVRPEDRATPAGIRAYNDTTHAIIDALPGKIWHFHVHDIDPATWQEHRPMGTGFVDYPRLIAKLRKIDYRGLLMLEIAGPGAEIEKLVADSARKIEAFL